VGLSCGRADVSERVPACYRRASEFPEDGSEAAPSSVQRLERDTLRFERRFDGALDELHEGDRLAVAVREYPVVLRIRVTRDTLQTPQSRGNANRRDEWDRVDRLLRLRCRHDAAADHAPDVNELCVEVRPVERVDLTRPETGEVR
jgi:hypothetical protein